MVARRGSLVCARSGAIRIAVGAHHVRSLTGEPPPGSLRRRGWWEVTRDEGRRWIDVGRPDQPHWLLLGNDVQVLEATELTVVEVPTLVAGHLASLGVVRLFRDTMGVGFVVDPRRLPAEAEA